MKLLTYGAYILHPRFDNVDLLLRHTILWCLAHHPAHRPELETLSQIVDEGGSTQDPGSAGADSDGGMTNAQLKEWFGKVLLEPRPRPLPKYHPEGPEDQVSGEGGREVLPSLAVAVR